MYDGREAHFAGAIRLSISLPAQHAEQHATAASATSALSRRSIPRDAKRTRPDSTSTDSPLRGNAAAATIRGDKRRAASASTAIQPEPVSISDEWRDATCSDAFEWPKRGPALPNRSAGAARCKEHVRWTTQERDQEAHKNRMSDLSQEAHKGERILRRYRCRKVATKDAFVAWFGGFKRKPSSKRDLVAQTSAKQLLTPASAMKVIQRVAIAQSQNESA